MLKFYRPFLPHAAATQAPLHTLLASTSTKGSQSINCTPELNRDFEECNASLSLARSPVRDRPHCPGDRRFDHGHVSSVATTD